MKAQRRQNIIIPLLCVGLLAACEEPPQVQEITQRTASAPTAKAVWPPPLKSGQNVVVAANVLAQNYYVVLDSSGSMADRACGETVSKSRIAKTALETFAQNVPDNSNLGLEAFDGSGTNERLPLRLAKEARKDFITKVMVIEPGGGTPLSTAITLGYQKLEEQAQKQLGYGEYHLVVVTDGEANYGYDPTKIVNYVVSSTPVVIHTIGFCIGEKHSLNQHGKTVYREAKDLKSLQEGLKEVLAESSAFDQSDFPSNQ